MNILVIGGAGFIGSSLSLSLAEQGHPVTVFDKFSYNHATREELSDINIITGDATVLSVVYRVFESVRPDVVFVLANTTYDTGIYSPFVESNTLVQIFSNIYNCFSVYTPKHVFVGSSCEVYKGSRGRPIKESYALLPSSFTGTSYQWVENFSTLISHKYKIGFTFLRYFHIYGNRRVVHPKYDVVSFLARHVKEKITVAISGKNIKVDCLHIDDAISATLTVVASRVEAIDTYAVNISSGIGISQKALYKKIVELSGGGFSKALYIPPSTQLKSLVGSNSVLVDLGWSPSVSLDKGIISCLG